MKELMNKGRKMYESYWAFETGKWTTIDCINRQVVPKIYDTFSKEVRPIAKVFKNLSNIFCLYNSLNISIKRGDCRILNCVFRLYLVTKITAELTLDQQSHQQSATDSSSIVSATFIGNYTNLLSPTRHTVARLVIMSVVSACVWLCLSVCGRNNSWTVRHMYHRQIFRVSSYGWKVDHVRKWPHRGRRLLDELFFLPSS